MWSLPVIVAALALQPAAGRPYPEERLLLDRHLAQVARALPDAPTPEADEKTLRDLAAEAGLRQVEVGPPTVTETGSIGQSRRTLLAIATFPDTDRFFRAVQTATRLIDVESLTLRPADFGVRIEARLRTHHRPAKAVASLSLDPSRLRERTRGASREDATRFARDEQVALEKSVALDDLRRRQMSPRLFLAETGAAFRDSAAALTFGSVENDTGRFVLRGLVAGMGAADALERRLENGFFRLHEFTRGAREACYQFEAFGDSFRAGPQAALPVAVDEPFRPTDGFCSADRDPARGSAPSLRAPASPGGAVTLRAVEADVADVAQMIETLAREPVVVSGDVRGRVSLETTGATVEDALKALPARLERAGAVFVLLPTDGSGGLPEPEDGPPPARVSFRGKRARGEDLLGAISDAEPSYAALSTAPLPKVSVFAREAAAADLRRALLGAMGFVESREDGTRVLRPLKGASGDPAPLTPAPGRPLFHAQDLAVDEIVLAGVGRTAGGEALAFVYSPLGDLVALRAGDALADGTIASVDMNGVAIDTAEGPVRISLTAARPR